MNLDSESPTCTPTKRKIEAVSPDLAKISPENKKMSDLNDVNSGNKDSDIDEDTPAWGRKVFRRFDDLKN